ncbi:hypothetical protein [Phaeobacter sp.]|uniref:hypothetical protein n=1 Tax=Phaeobacter sp. TaxID=1902409 RepID=UPI0025E51C88|nr:hypothetical protein [Phaeobacter sp.]
MIVLLATAPGARLPRSRLQEVLWGQGDYDTGHQNLRRALSDLRKLIGPFFDTLFHVSSRDVELDLAKVRFVGSARDGAFLADLSIREPGFASWQAEVNADNRPLAPLFGRQAFAENTRLAPRISVLPLTAIGGAPDLPAVGDWVAQEACRMMSRSALVTVISHLSGRVVSKGVIDVPTIRQKLDVDYLLYGSIRTMGDDLVLDLDLIEAVSGEIVWNRQTTCRNVDIANALLPWLEEVVRSVGKTIARNALREARSMPLSTLSNHALLIAGATAMHGPHLQDFVRAHGLFDEAVRRAPQNPHPRAWLGKWYVLSIFKGLSADRKADSQKAQDCTAQALDMDPESSFAMTIDGFLHCNILGDMQTAENRYFCALDVSPNESLAWLLRGSLMAFRDEGSAAVRATTLARSLSPVDPFGYYFDSLASSAHLAGGDYETALRLAEKSISKNDSHLSTLRTRIAALHLLDRGAEAQAAAQDLQVKFPDFRLEEYRKTHPSMGYKIGQTMVAALAASGVR